MFIDALLRTAQSPKFNRKYIAKKKTINWQSVLYWLVRCWQWKDMMTPYRAGNISIMSVNTKTLEANAQTKDGDSEPFANAFFGEIMRHNVIFSQHHTWQSGHYSFKFPKLFALYSKVFWSIFLNNVDGRLLMSKVSKTAHFRVSENQPNT